MPLNKKVKTGFRIHRAGGVRVGDLVKVAFGAHPASGRVVEDRGKIGVKGRQLYRVVIMMNNEPMSLELPADEIQIVRRAKKASTTATKSKYSQRKVSKLLPKTEVQGV